MVSYPFTCIFFILLFSLNFLQIAIYCFQNDLVVQPKIQSNWTSLKFLISMNPPYEPIPYSWTVCTKFSNLYCLENYEASTDGHDPALAFYYNGTYVGTADSIYELELQALNKYKFRTQKKKPGYA